MMRKAQRNKFFNIFVPAFTGKKYFFRERHMLRVRLFYIKNDHYGAVVKKNLHF